ncbi:hypothetical protein B0H13DRAFT_162644 [Mycena leptocephala]|nr:hypothetical protein B0H13DRAFT_162644 [Mycena leptocephala]
MASVHIDKKISTACLGLQTALSMAKEVAANFAVPGLAAGLSALLLVVGAIQQTAQNSDDIDSLASRIMDLTSILRNNTPRSSVEVTGALEMLSTTLRSVSEGLNSRQTHGWIRRVVTKDADSAWLKAQIDEVNKAIDKLKIVTILRLDSTMNDVHSIVKDTKETVDNIQQVVQANLPQGRYLPQAIQAAFQSQQREPCAPSTRKEILDEVFNWIDDEKSQPNAPARPIFWLKGSAGTGKSTIAYTVATRCRKQGTLGASFFCSRLNSICSDSSLIFTTIAHQLGIFNPVFAYHVARAQAVNPDIGYAAPQFQLAELIIQPLRAAREEGATTFPGCVVILDALDECNDTSTSPILSALSSHISDLSPLKILITSRPQPLIIMGFTHLRPHIEELDLNNASAAAVEKDIQCYLTGKLEMVRIEYDLQEWPQTHDIIRLARLSSGLFIFASTAINFIQDTTYLDPASQLSRLVDDDNTQGEGLSPYDQLDQLYMQILTVAFDKVSPILSSRLRLVLGSVVYLRTPLSPSALENLLQLRPRQARQTLLKLQSLIIVPAEDDESIRLLHPSFVEFANRCRLPIFSPSTEQHSQLAQFCLTAMSTTLKRDICQLKRHSLLNSEIVNLPALITTNILPHIRYACCHWVYHVSKGTMSDPLLRLLDEFCSQHLLHWIEICSLTGDLRSALISVTALNQVLFVCF